MLVALMANGQSFICTSHLSRQELKKLRMQEQFYCPQCKELVQLKIGDIKIPHFAHTRKSSCEQYFSEGESAQHLLGKEQLYQMFQRLLLHVELETYIKELSQRPDLLVIDKHGKRFAIEFQCSPISSELLQKRSDGYLSKNITPIWIFLTPSKMIPKATAIQKMSFSTMLQQRKIGKSYYNQYILTYSPSQQAFYYFSHLLHIYDNQFITKSLMLPIQHQIFPFYEPAPLTQQDIATYALLYSKNLQQYSLTKIMTNKQGINHPYLRACYELRLNPQKLPYYIGIPVPYANAIPMSTVEWQMQLLYFAFLRGKGLQVFNNKDCQQFLQWIHLPETVHMLIAIQAYIMYFKEALTAKSQQPLNVGQYLVNQLLLSWKIEKI